MSLAKADIQKKEFSILIVSRTDLLNKIVGSKRLANIGAQKLGYNTYVNTCTHLGMHMLTFTTELGNKISK